MKQSGVRWYFLGLFGIVIAVLAFQLIWLPAPLVHTRQLQWIEVVDWLYYVILLIPSCWLIGAWQSARAQYNELASKSGRAMGWKLGMKGLLAVGIMKSFPAVGIMMGNVLLFGLLLRPFHNLLLVIVLFVLSLMLIIVDLYVHRIGHHHSSKKITVNLICYATILVILLCPTGYQVTYPAMTMNMSQYAQFIGDAERSTAAKVEHTKASLGEETASSLANDTKSSNSLIDGVLVFERPAFPIDWLYSKQFPQVVLRKQEANEPSIRETYSQVAQMKSDANQLAAAMAWERAGKGKAIYNDGAAVIAIIADSPADGMIHANDVIVGVNQHTITSRADLQQYMSGYVEPGDQVEVELRRGEQVKKISVTTIAASDDEQRPVLGIIIQDAYHIKLDQRLELSSYLLHAGGPSHGAMLTLALLDQLTNGNTTGDLQVAGTGTIEVDGSIGMVGGIPQKAYAVSRTPADVFFVPAASVEVAQAAAPELNIVGVETFSDILHWLEELFSQVE